MTTELKTLKDIDLNIDDIHDIDKPDAIDALKSEAIKWVKEGLNYRNYEEQVAIEAITNWIKHFFNLTEEDLK